MAKKHSKKELTPEQLGRRAAQRALEDVIQGRAKMPFECILGVSLDDKISEFIEKTNLETEDVPVYLIARDIPEEIFNSPINDIVYLWGNVGILTTKTALRSMNPELRMADLYNRDGPFYPCNKVGIRPEDKVKIELKYNIKLE